ncbi:hypothetical protein [Sorangium sp. So ce1000]|uniref:hypothetical protein n=1 Tax=Sorangium sp. So ce1000 TaxID=3133325 RepID=UPI003F62D3BA
MIALSLELVNFVESLKLRPVKDIAASFERLGKWLSDRVKKAEAIEQRSRRFPVIQFYNGAVVLFIDPIQKDALAPDEPPKSFLDHLREGGRRFAEGLKDTVALPANEAIIPNLLDALDTAVKAVLASVERFMKPDRALFDTDARKASDVFGEAALAFQVLASSKEQLIGARGSGGFAAALKLLMAPKGEEGGPLESASALPDLLQDLVRYIVGGLFLIPVGAELVKRVWKEATIFIRAKAIDVFSDIEQEVFGVRREIVDLFYVDLRDALRDAISLAEAWSTAAVGFVRLFVGASRMFSEQLITTFGKWFGELQTFMRKVVDVFGYLENLLDALVKIDLMELLVPVLAEKLGKVWWIVAKVSDVPTLRIEELAEPQTRARAYARFDAWLNQIKKNLGRVAFVVGGLIGRGALRAYIESKLKPVRDVLKQAIAKPSADVAETSAFQDLKIPGLPDIGSVLTKWIAPLRGSVSGFIDTLGKETKAITDKGAEMLEALGLRFDRAAASALRGPSAKQFLAISEKAGELAKRAFPDTDVAGPAPEAAFVEMAKQFDAWVARAGIEVAGAALPYYFVAMRRYFEEQQQRGEESTVRLPEDLPTSPHIMALRPALARTLVPRLTIKAHGRALDDALVDDVAAAFLLQVQEAHGSGQRKIDRLQATADEPGVRV